MVKRASYERLAEELHSQTLLQSLLDTASDAILSVDKEHRIVIFNLQAEQLFGYTAEEILGEPLSLLLPERFREHHNQHMEEFVREPSSRRLMASRSELVALRKDGSVFPVEISISKVKMSTGELLLTAIIRDVTERREAALALKRAHDELETRVEQRTADLRAANEELRKFTYIVSHDLRAPLVNLKGFAGELRFALDDLSGLLQGIEVPDSIRSQMRDLLEQDVPESLAFIESAVSRMDRLINAILKLSRLGHQKLFIQPVDLQKVVRESLESLTHQIEQAGITVEVGTLPRMNADPTSLTQIVDNLLSNAVKFMRPSVPGRIKVYATESREGHTIHVEDNGRGIASEDMDKIFQIFRRAGSQDVPGEGMGLSYVQAIIRRHGGAIRCVSRLGEGSTFSFTIPFDPEDRREL